MSTIESNELLDIESQKQMNFYLNITVRKLVTNLDFDSWFLIHLVYHEKKQQKCKRR